MSTKTEQPTPDYGEPWSVGSIHKPLLDCNSHDPLLLHRTTRRAVVCVNVCRGMANPAAEIQAMRDALKDAQWTLTAADLAKPSF